ncbi:uncharacterized protein LOC132639630 [Lycium barbarum]|uniref:uncharacterized protein LOC132639630 n=1 Tax=Lycium barbarum TaxID=112863 RepID=UPI00293E7C4F|nr:uncharacterized protein LOC132639630 [Lycium barbarum]
MPFGLKNAGATYQRLVTTMFKDQFGKTMEVYIDVMVVKSERAEDYLIHLKEAFAILRQFNMKLNPEKCVFGVSSGKFLGSMVSKRGIEINPNQINAIENIPDNLSSIKEVQSLKLALEYKAESIKVHCDSQLVVNQVPRESNAEAGGLAKLASTADPAEPGSWSVIHLLHPISSEIEIRATRSTHNWRNEILDYLQQGTLPLDKKEARKLQVKASRYCLVYGELYRRTFGGPLAKCLVPT